MQRFRDRREAGRALARALSQYANRDDVVVLGLPRGGVPVAFEVASALRAPLDVFLVRKLGVPGHEELAMGAIASGGVRVVNDEVVRGLRVPFEDIARVVAAEQQELARRERLYRGDCALPSVEGRVAILVDDGLATGMTMRAAVEALRALEPSRIVVASPVGSASACRAMRDVAQDVVCVLAPERFQAVGQWYDDFAQTGDDEVIRLLDDARRLPQGRVP